MIITKTLQNVKIKFFNCHKFEKFTKVSNDLYKYSKYPKTYIDNICVVAFSKSVIGIDIVSLRNKKYSKFESSYKLLSCYLKKKINIKKISFVNHKNYCHMFYKNDLFGKIYMKKIILKKKNYYLSIAKLLI